MKIKFKLSIDDLFALVVIIVVTTAIIAALSLATMWVWNWILPNIIICKEINFWQAAGILFLISLLTFDKSKLFGWLYE